MQKTFSVFYLNLSQRLKNFIKQIQALKKKKKSISNDGTNQKH